MEITKTELAAFVIATAGCVLSAGMTRMLLPFFYKLARNANWLRPNFKGDPVPASAGTVMLLAFMTTGCFALIAGKPFGIDARIPEILFLALGMSFLGLLDDAFGSRETGGFRGHTLKMFRDGELTTGLIKAAGGFLLTLCLVLADLPKEEAMSNGMVWLSIFTDASLIALMANSINLLDVRPGRALKTVLLAIVILLPFVVGSLSIPLMMLAGAVVAYFPADIRARAMMGDVGANFVGAVTGYFITQSFGWTVKAILLLLLIALHLYAEYRSLSKLIEKNRWLSWIDEWGREEAR